VEVIRRIVAIPFGLLALAVLLVASGLSCVALAIAAFAKWVCE